MGVLRPLFGQRSPLAKSQIPGPGRVDSERRASNGDLAERDYLSGYGRRESVVGWVGVREDREGSSDG